MDTLDARTSRDSELDSAQNTRRIRVAVIFGGRSSEHGISCLTAAGVMRVIDRTRYDVVPIGITAAGVWVIEESVLLEWPGLDSGTLPQVSPDGMQVSLPLSVSDRAVRRTNSLAELSDLGTIDVVFPLLHGPFGEDGTVQGLLELGDIPYVGSGVFASAASMDKHFMKVLLAGQGLPIGPYQVVTDHQWRVAPEKVLDRLPELGFPMFVKPARAGSSVGVTRVGSLAELPAAIAEARRHDPKIVVEAAIIGRELECGVLQDLQGLPQASELGEIELLDGYSFYDFAAKYLRADEVSLSAPAKVSDEVREQVQNLAIQAFEAMGCEGLARVDVFYTDSGQVIINELNTMPGFTESSMFPRLWAAAGVDYPELVDRLIQLACRRSTGLR